MEQQRAASRTGSVPIFRIGRMDGADLPEVAAIEADSFSDPWTEAELRELLRDHGTAGCAALVDGVLVGYLIYCLSRGRVEIACLGVLADCRGCGIGTAMVGGLLWRLTDKRPTVLVDLDVADLDAQRFFRKLGFVAAGVVDSMGAEWYRFVFRRGWPLPGEEA